MKPWHRQACVLALGVAQGACGSSANGALAAPTSADTNATGGGTSSGGGSGNSGGEFGASGDDASAESMLPAEMKSESNYQSPVATGSIVWSANPTNDEVAYIDATNFTVQTVLAGNAPTYLAAVPSPGDAGAAANDVAIVQNVVSQDATLLIRSASGAISATTFESTSYANSWAVSPSGRWAIAWANASQIATTVSADSYANVAVMDLSTANPGGTGQSTVMAVGYRPSQVAFAGDSYAYVVQQDGITQIDLQGPTPVTSALFPLSALGQSDAAETTLAATTTIDGSSEGGAEPLDATATPEAGPDASAGVDGGTDASTVADASTASDAGATTVIALPPEDDGGSSSTPDVSFTRDGNYALVRQDGVASITVVSLSTGTLTTVPLPSAPTDLDLSPQGGFALAALRDASAVAVLPIPGVVSDPAGVTIIPVPGVTVGRVIVTPDEKSALVFTTVTTAPEATDLTVLALSPPSARVVDLHEPVLAVFPTPDSKNAVVLHDVTPSNGVLGAYSLVPIAASLPVQLVPTPAEPTSVAISSESDRVVIALRDDPTMSYDLDLGLFPSLQSIRTALASPPIAAGIVAGAGQGYAAQDYTEGRITFVSLYPADGGTPGAAVTITGFDLGARIVDNAIGGDQ
jgi:hypothetical protein